MSKRMVMGIGVAVAVVAGSAAVLVTRPRVLSGDVGAPRLLLYTGEGFTGRVMEVTGTLLDLPVEKEPDGSEFNWNDKVRSLVVYGGAWRLFQHGRLNTRLDDTKLEDLDIHTKRPAPGWSAVVSATAEGALEIPDLAAAGLALDLSSVELLCEENLPGWALSARR
jgi:FAD/FMN-containing dehydrogenase